VATSAGPDIAVPSSWAQPGYSVNHAQYSAERECWAKQAYAVPPAETISLEITAVQEGGNRRKGACGIPFGVRRWIMLNLSHTDNSEFQNICEGRKDIDAPGLIALSLDTTLLKIQAFATDFSWCQDQFIIRDGGWVDLSTHPPRQPYFYSQCTQATCKGSRAMTFKSKQFLLYVIVPMAQWEDYEMWLEKAEEVCIFNYTMPVHTYQKIYTLRNDSACVHDLSHSFYLLQQGASIQVCWLWLALRLIPRLSHQLKHHLKKNHLKRHCPKRQSSSRFTMRLQVSHPCLPSRKWHLPMLVSILQIKNSCGKFCSLVGLQT
jgi:hypothetical protein